MRKSKAVNLTTIHESDSYDGGYGDDSNFQGDFSDESETPHLYNKTIQHQLLQFKMQDFEQTKSSGLPPITDEEFNVAEINIPFLPKLDPTPVPIECVFMMISGSNHFPHLSSDYQKMHPLIYLWRDVRNVLETEFSSYAQNYFKEHYTSIKTRLRFFPHIDPTVDKLNSVMTIRRDIPNGQILYHYIGYGFLTIADSTISCFDKKTGNHAYYPLKKLFESIKPPAFFIFDCSNAASTIPCLESTSRLKKEEAQKGIMQKEQFITRKIDWDEWLCICATGYGENLPNDPHLPRDFLTSCIFTPVRTSVVCHTLQYYRSSIVTNNFPLDCYDNPLFLSDSPICISLEHALSAIVDAIAAESLPPNLYKSLFRKDPFISLLFKRFLLAQYLLKPYQVHPTSHPNLPDLSCHPLWLHWKMIIDIVVTKYLAKPNSAAKEPNEPAKIVVKSNSFTENLFLRTLQSINGFLNSNQESEIPQSLITLLFYFPHNNPMQSSVYSTLAQYASFSQETRIILSKSAVFTSLFNSLINDTLSVETLHNLCYLIISLIKTTPEFIHEISKFNIGTFPNKIFDARIPSQTKSLILVILSTLVPINETVRCSVISGQFLSNVKNLLETSDTVLSLWLIIIIRRIFDSYGYKLDLIYNLALHTQIATFVHHNSYEVRAAALGALSCMLQHSEDTINQQIFCLVFFTAFDPSYLVRYNFILFLGRFLSIYHSSINDALAQIGEGIDAESAKSKREPNRLQSISANFKHQSFSSLMNMLFKTNIQLENKPFSFKFLTSIASSETMSISKLVSVGIYLNDLMVEDSHPSVVAAALEIKSFVARSEQLKKISCQISSQNEDEEVPRQLTRAKIGKNSNNNNSVVMPKITNMSTFVTSTVSNDDIHDSESNPDTFFALNGKKKRTPFYGLDSESNSSASLSPSNSIGQFPVATRMMIPESGGDSVFRISLNQVVNSGNWRIVEEQPAHEMLGSLPIGASTAIPPTTKIVTRKVVNLNVGRPVRFSYYEKSLSFSYASDEGVVVFYDEQQKQLTSISIDSNVTSLKIKDWNLQPLVLIGTDEGNVYVWDPKHQTPCITFRADWPGKNVEFRFARIAPKEKSVDTTINSSSFTETSNNSDVICPLQKVPSAQQIDASSMVGAGNAANAEAFSSASASSYGMFNPSSFLPSSSSPPSFSPPTSLDSQNAASQQGITSAHSATPLNSFIGSQVSSTSIPQPSQQFISTSSSFAFAQSKVQTKLQNIQYQPGRSLSFTSNINRNFPGTVTSPPPLVLSFVPGKNQIVSSRGNNGIVRLWDINYQKLVAEYSTGAKEAVTAIAMNPLSADSCVAGFRNGLIVELDLRCCADQNRNLQNIAAPRALEEIVNIVGNTGANKNPMFVAATRKGTCLKWNSLENCEVMEIVGKDHIVDFDCHLQSPLIVLSPLNSPPIITDFNGNVIHTLKNVANGSICAFHPLLPTIAFGTPKGEIVSAELTG